MKFAVNKTIANYLYQFYQKPLPETYAKRWTRQLMLAIQYLHEECRIAHRDLKLENILLNRYGQPKISDFSLSLIWDGKRLATDWCGTPPYFAPEILQG